MKLRKTIFNVVIVIILLAAMSVALFGCDNLEDVIDEIQKDSSKVVDHEYPTVDDDLTLDEKEPSDSNEHDDDLKDSLFNKIDMFGEGADENITKNYYYIGPKDVLSGALDESDSRYTVYNDKIRSIGKQRFDGGVSNGNKTYSTTLLNNKNIAEEQFVDGYLSFAQYGDSYCLSTEYSKDTIIRKINDKEKYKYVYNEFGRITSKYVDGVLAETYEYNDNREVTRITNHKTNFAYEMIWENGAPTKVLQYVYRSGKYVRMKYINFQDYARGNESTEYDHGYNNVSYLSAKTTDMYRYEYSYINNIAIKSTVKEFGSGKIKNIEYLFDSAMNRIGFLCDEELFYYIYDLQGNVTHIVDSSGTVVLTYEYDIVGKATVSGDRSELAYFNSYAYRAKDNWIFDYSLQQYFESDDVYSAKCGKDINGAMFASFAKDTVNRTVKNGVLHTIKPSLEYKAGDYDEIEDKIAELSSSALIKSGFDCYKKLPSVIEEHNSLAGRLDIVAVPNNDNIIDIPKAFVIVNSSQQHYYEEIDKIKDISEKTVYVNIGENYYEPAFADFGVKGHFVLNGMYVKFFDINNVCGTIVYEATPYQKDVYDDSFGNLYNYDTANYEHIGDVTIPYDEFVKVKSVYEKIDYDAILEEINGSDCASPHKALEVTDLSVNYISLDYIMDVIENSREPLFVGGRTLSEMISEFGKNIELVNYDGRIELKENVPPEELYGKDWSEFAKDTAIGTGVILVGAAITVGTGGGGLVCFITTAAAMAGTAALSGLINATADCAANDDWENFPDEFARGYKFSAVTVTVTQLSAGLLGGSAFIPATCFTEGTSIALVNGSKPIEDIKVGDRVQSYDFNADCIQNRRVSEVFENETNILVKLSIGNDLIETTESHPFYVVNRGWVRARDISVGDELLSADGGIERVHNKLVCHFAKAVKVYNFEVEDNHNYFVGNERVLVHNTCGSAGALTNPNTVEKLGSVFRYLAKTGATIKVTDRLIDACEIVNNNTVVLSSKGTKWDDKVQANVITQLQEILDSGEEEQRIYFRVVINSGDIIHIDLSKAYTLEEAKNMIMYTNPNFVTLYEKDARKLIETAFGSGYVPYKCTSKNEINHYHLSLVGQNYPFRWEYDVDGQIKIRSIHSCYLIGE